MDKGKVTAKINPSHVFTLQSRPPSRPHSPLKTKPHTTMPVEPTPRLKAKVSTSATVVIGRSSSSSGTDNKSTTRPPSPFKQSRGHARKLSSTRSAVDVHISRPKAPLAAHELSRQRSLTSTLETSLTGSRRSDGSFHPTTPSSPSPRLSPESAPASPAVRVKAKVSNLAKSSGFSTSPSPASTSHPSSPSFATTRPIESRPRAPSITDLSSIFGSRPSTVPVTVHPITTPTSAANPHRYSPRIPSNTASTRFQALSPLSSRGLDNGVHHVRVSSKIDPAAIPLPPQSPPASTLSFSSQSSKDTQGSSISGSTAPTPNSHLHGTSPALGSGPDFDVFDEIRDPSSPRHSLDSPVIYTEQVEDSDRKIRAEAKTNRKIEDLEITNRSLLAINAALETTKHRQANEIRELRRKLRESRLMLPPRAFRAIKSSLGPEDVADDEDIGEDGNDNDDDDEHDETYGRIKGILENMLETGRRALRAEPRDFDKPGGGVKVLSAEEVRSWRGNMGDDISSIHSAATDTETDEEHHPQRDPPMVSQAADSENETDPSRHGDEEAVVTDRDEVNAVSLPPITVTFS